MTRFNFFILTFIWLIGIFYDIEIWAVETGKGRTKVGDKGIGGLKFVAQVFPELRKYADPLYLEQVWCFITFLVNGILLMSLSHVTMMYSDSIYKRKCPFCQNFNSTSFNSLCRH